MHVFTEAILDLLMSDCLSYSHLLLEVLQNYTKMYCPKAMVGQKITTTYVSMDDNFITFLLTSRKTYFLYTV